MRGGGWSDKRIELLKRLWAEGKTATAIATRLGSSRSAVLGKIFRLRFDAADNGKSSKARARPTVDDRNKKVSRATRRSAPSRRRRSVNEKSSANEPRPAASSVRKTLFELTNACCRWPHGRPGAKNFFFCGAAGADLERGMPYCARHMRRAYLVAPAILIQAQRIAARAA